ncbi:brain-specific angiogenesis inhibitor 1-associated protein 2-like protein 1 isoform X1 [Gambusia affinis]|uniref:brain-specific angiogenesis inhibitor 1-associated protein 2-like protein 1 isoform X1 n=1 Tax=Gambusia affinis TaxID=33528 RepID=UPI001CDB7686|nr:brain-specific angiogenesis inhibitor 1-associated protein 2-like protein 1 isoform X1 [Gambusia affinis]
MARTPDGVSKLTESTFKNVMEQFNPALRNLVNLGKSYEKSVTAMTAAGKSYFNAVSKIGENAMVSPMSRELGVVLKEMAESHWKLHTELEENFKRFHREIIVELEKKTDMDVKYMTATFKRYQTDYKQKQESLDRSQTDLKKLKRKGQSKHAFKYDLKENEYLETISSRQMDMQKFIADGCREALVEEKRRFWFLAEKHCMFSSQLSSFHDKAKELLSTRLPSWQERCSNVDKVPDTVASMIQGLSTDPESAQTRRHSKNHVGPLTPPPAPPLKISPLANMFNPEPRTPLSPSSDLSSVQGSLGDLSRSTSMSSGLSGGTKFQVKTIFPHTAGNNDTLLSFDHGDVITLLIHQEKDGWLYGELDRTQQRGWFPSSYCRPYADQSTSSSSSLSAASLQEEEEGDEDYEPVLLPPPDYSDVNPSKPALPETPPPQNTVSLLNGTAKPPFLGGGNPFATVRLRPTVTNDRSAPVI